MTSAAIVQKLWNYCNVLRDDGMSYLLACNAQASGDYPSNSLRAGSEQLTHSPSPSPSPRGRGDRRGMADDLFDHYRHMLESLGKGFSPSPLDSSPIEGEELLPLLISQNLVSGYLPSGKFRNWPNNIVFLTASSTELGRN